MHLHLYYSYLSDNRLGGCKQQLQFAMISIDFNYSSTDLFITSHYSICCTVIYRLLYSFARYYLTVLLQMVIAQPKLFKSAIVKSLLIVQYKLFSVVQPKRNESDVSRYSPPLIAVFLSCLSFFVCEFNSS